MGKLIAIVGGTGAGKTTLTRVLCQATGWACAVEDLDRRPFQALFKQDHRRYALANQVDFLLYRAEQERAIRQGPVPGVVDGGLDQDFFVFTRLFHQKGYLTDGEYQLLERLHSLLRSALPAPDLLIYLAAPVPVQAERFRRRGRPLEIATLADLEAIQALLERWLDETPYPRLLRVDAGREDPGCEAILDEILANVEDFAGDK